MLVGSGGGSISVEPAAVRAMAARITSISASTSSVHGSVSGAGGAAAGCQAAAAFARMQSVVVSALGALDDCSTMLGQAVANGVEAYVVTDDTQIPGANLSCPANP
jgi:hypothetical protein